MVIIIESRKYYCPAKKTDNWEIRPDNLDIVKFKTLKQESVISLLVNIILTEFMGLWRLNFNNVSQMLKNPSFVTKLLRQSKPRASVLSCLLFSKELHISLFKFWMPKSDIPALYRVNIITVKVCFLFHTLNKLIGGLKQFSNAFVKVHRFF